MMLEPVLTELRIHPWWGIGMVLGLLALVLAGVKRLVCRRSGDREMARKCVHVAMGLICLMFPWIFTASWPVWILAGGATLGLMAVRMVPLLREGVGEGLHGIERWSVGELLFAPAVALVFELADGRTALFIAPVAILTLADAAAALAGIRWGRNAYVAGAGRKSVEGSAAFLICAILCAGLPLMAFEEMGADRILWLALATGLLATMAEGLADRGSDNLLLPLWVLLLMDRFAELEARELMLRFGGAVLLLVVVVVCGGLSTLGGGALLAAGLLGYGLMVLGGPWFMLPVAGLFAVHLHTSWRHQLGRRLRHGREPVFGVAVATLPWVMIGGVREAGELGCAIASAAMLMMMHAGTRNYLELGGRDWLTGIGKTVIFTLGPVLLMLGSWQATGLALVGMAGAMAAVRVDDSLRRRWPLEPKGLWLARGGLALLASAPAMLFHRELS